LIFGEETKSLYTKTQIPWPSGIREVGSTGERREVLLRHWLVRSDVPSSTEEDTGTTHGGGHYYYITTHNIVETRQESPQNASNNRGTV